jgi:small nuclear ribonucleoprotein (snRNP)-like protein
MTDTFYEKIKTKIGNMVKVKTDFGKTIIGRLAAYNQYDGVRVS